MYNRKTTRMRYRNHLLFLASLLALTILLISTKHKEKQQANPRMYFAAITVKNIDTSLAWYSRMYNLVLKNRVDNDQRGFKQLNLVNDNMWIELVELKTGVDKSILLKNGHEKSEINGISKIGFISDDIENTYNELKAKGADFFRGVGIFNDPVSKKRGFMITDPDGNLLQYFEK